MVDLPVAEAHASRLHSHLHTLHSAATAEAAPFAHHSVPPLSFLQALCVCPIEAVFRQKAKVAPAAAVQRQPLGRSPGRARGLEGDESTSSLGAMLTQRRSRLLHETAARLARDAAVRRGNRDRPEVDGHCTQAVFGAYAEGAQDNDHARVCLDLAAKTETLLDKRLLLTHGYWGVLAFGYVETETVLTTLYQAALRQAFNDVDNGRDWFTFRDCCMTNGTEVEKVDLLLEKVLCDPAGGRAGVHPGDFSATFHQVLLASYFARTAKGPRSQRAHAAMVADACRRRMMIHRKCLTGHEHEEYLSDLRRQIGAAAWADGQQQASVHSLFGKDSGQRLVEGLASRVGRALGFLPGTYEVVGGSAFARMKKAWDGKARWRNITPEHTDRTYISGSDAARTEAEQRADELRGRELITDEGAILRVYTVWVALQPMEGQDSRLYFPGATTSWYDPGRAGTGEGCSSFALGDVCIFSADTLHGATPHNNQKQDRISIDFRIILKKPMFGGKPGGSRVVQAWRR